MIGQRQVSTVFRAFFQHRHYIAFLNMLKVYPSFWENFSRYVFASGSYPYQIKLLTPIGTVNPMLYSHQDMLTVNEIFYRCDYAMKGEVRVVVDIGANIGISGLYFLTRNLMAVCYLYEPVPRNIERLKINLL